MKVLPQISMVTSGVLLAMSAMASEPSTLSDALTSGPLHLDFRYRLETVNQDGFAQSAVASTLRTRINYGTLAYKGISAFVEADNVSYLGEDKFNNTRNGQTAYPTVADPDGTDLNQLYVKYASTNGGATLGRQRINLDNQRFIGGVGWRQNEQTYDAAAISFSRITNLDLLYGYVNRIARVFGPDAGSPPATLDSSSHIVHAHYNAGARGEFSGYGYFLDVVDVPSVSSRTLGIRYTNEFARGSYQFPITVEYARQNDFADNPLSFSANYFHFETGVKTSALQVAVGDEILGADTSAGVAFSTPLATLHAFQGWADMFLSTPAKGIDDRYLSFKGGEGGTSFSITWHDFNSDVDCLQYGHEVDFSFAQKLDDHVSLLVKYANYNADGFGTNTNKLWLVITASLAPGPSR
ncbi:MAG TPA: alginate export family protein [Pseudomonadales bacterium]|nr:alginate export family protein [Pseudomonadales bacterium]